MTLSDIDRQLLDRCLDNEPQSWEAFIDRFLGLVVHVVNHTATSRGVTLPVAERDDMVAEVFLTLVNNDRAVLRRFRRQSSLATYLTVIARRVIVHQLATTQRNAAQKNRIASEETLISPVEQQVEDRDQLEQMLARLDPKEADVVRMHHLEGKTYREIGNHLGLPENSVGPMLSRARDKMRQSQPGV
ncbi:RNA polymerase sigma factor [Rosistilla oblonga]|uniref:RNA polymerase sigma factor n=1 Tax=Rosistilla oblonga TaxID=2527990 RepID=UPI003A96C6B0